MATKKEIVNGIDYTGYHEYPVGYWKYHKITDLETSHIKNILKSNARSNYIECESKIMELENELRIRALEERIKILESRL
jgi:hypothetical protein